ncbi:hypothetical protein PROFUN_05831 [Planoprotostelium fungivorum]|uniref:Uncharacterized protein n=1 Tax=Planoprotostelium fungivorum TaxID=1890364 RepID=A0A2P6NKP0_9EUKA|nr:hypothetical protein PROFUN_05831 [Planoprotostelium fungivorum]
MLSFGPLGSQDHITSYDLMSITNKTPPDQLETTRIAFYAMFYARRPILTPGTSLFGQHMTLDSNSTLNSTPEDPLLSHKRTKLSHEVRSHLTSTPTLVLPRAHLLSTHIRFTLRATSALSLLLDRDLALRIARPFLLNIPNSYNEINALLNARAFSEVDRIFTHMDIHLCRLFRVPRAARASYINRLGQDAPPLMGPGLRPDAYRWIFLTGLLPTWISARHIEVALTCHAYARNKSVEP